MKAIPVFITFIGLLFISCQNLDEGELAADFDFKFRLLDESGIPSTKFNDGANFIFSLLIINKNEEPWFYHSGIDDNENFLRVFEISGNNQQEIDRGRPWKTMFCNYVAGYAIQPSDTFKIEIPWINSGELMNEYKSNIFCLLNEQESLTKGSYTTHFSSFFRLSKGDSTYISEEIKFNIDFTFF